MMGKKKTVLAHLMLKGYSHLKDLMPYKTSILCEQKDCIDFISTSYHVSFLFK